MILKISEFGKSVGTRNLAKEIRKQLESAAKNGEKVIIDFTDVDIISNAFADELIGVFIRHNGVDKLKAICKFKGTNTEVKAVLTQVIYSNI